MEETLGIFYETLKWIENAATDLKYQVEEIDKQVNNN